MGRLILVILLTLLVVLPAQAQQAPYPSAILADGPVGYWRLNGPSAATDSAGVNHGTYNGGLTSGATGATADGDAAVQLDGVDDYVSVPDSASLSPTATLSVEAWVYLDAYPATGQFFNIVNKANAYALQAEAHSAGTASLQFQLYHPTGRVQTEAAKTVLKTGQWAHIVATYDGTTSVLYVNGVQVAAVAQTGPINDTATPLTIGANSNTVKGRVDEVAVYPSALTQAQIDVHRTAALQMGAASTATPTLAATASVTATGTAAPTDTATPTSTATLVTATATDTPITTVTATPTPTAAALPYDGVLCAGLAVGPNAVTVTCARDNTATPWPLSWPLAPGTLNP